jgi:hypothetical protein
MSYTPPAIDHQMDLTADLVDAQFSVRRKLPTTE